MEEEERFGRRKIKKRSQGTKVNERRCNIKKERKRKKSWRIKGWIKKSWKKGRTEATEKARR